MSTLRPLLLPLAVLVLHLWSPAATGDVRPNVVLIIADYMGYQDTAPYGSTDIRTPAISRLANEGVRFTNFYAASPVCGPARAALYTGRYPAKIGFEQNIRSETDGLDASVPTLSRWLVDAGYRTALYGKWHLGYGRQHSPGSHGFQEFLGHLHWTISYYTHVNDQGEPGLYDNNGLVEREGYLTDILTDEAAGFIDRHPDGNGPFFLTLAYNAALPPYQPPGLPESEWGSGWDVAEASRDDVVKMVERMDTGIGRVLDTLDANGLTDNTMVIYTHDHGGRHLVDHGPLFHGFANLYEAGIRVPAIIRYPNHLPAGRTVSMPGISMDLTATILTAAGLGDVAESLDGMDLVPLPSEHARLIRRTFYWQNDFYDFGKQRAIIDGGFFKYMEHGNTRFLFDLREDVGERNNLYYKQQEYAERLRTRLTQWQHSVSGGSGTPE